MSVEVIGIDYVYVTVRDLRRSEGFYDRVMPVLGFRKGRGDIGGDPHLHYYNRQFGYSLRPAREATSDHDPYAPGLHHFCFRVVDEAAVDRAARTLREAGVDATEPRHYPEYDPDYYATFFEDPDGVRLEVTNFRERRRKLSTTGSRGPTSDGVRPIGVALLQWTMSAGGYRRSPHTAPDLLVGDLRKHFRRFR